VTAEIQERWTDVADVADLAATGRHVCELEGRSILLCRTGGDIVAVSNSCTHLGQPLEKGRIMGGRIFCPHHSACFDLRTGEAESGPAVTPLPCYPVRVEEGRVWIRPGWPQPASSAEQIAGEVPSVTDGPTEHKITMEPAGVVIGVGPEESVLTAAFREGYRWPSVCGGEAMCGTCFLKVHEGAENISPVGDGEAFRLKFIGRSNDPAIRLACQMHLSGDVVAFKRGVRKLDS
jgi:nitrite reductase/ring-hydroxylating ferredoxin subunit/ferredoxin